MLWSTEGRLAHLPHACHLASLFYHISSFDLLSKPLDLHPSHFFSSHRFIMRLSIRNDPQQVGLYVRCCPFPASEASAEPCTSTDRRLPREAHPRVRAVPREATLRNGPANRLLASTDLQSPRGASPKGRFDFQGVCIQVHFGSPERRADLAALQNVVTCMCASGDAV